MTVNQFLSEVNCKMSEYLCKWQSALLYGKPSGEWVEKILQLEDAVFAVTSPNADSDDISTIIENYVDNYGLC